MILVTGATGNVGRPLVELLISEGVEVRAVTRDPATAALPAGAEVVEGDPSRPETIAPLLDGVTALFVNPRAVGLAAGGLLALARHAGATRAVAVSAINVDDDFGRQPSRYRGDFNKEVEEAVVNSGLEWVSLRSALYPSNTVGLWGAQIRAGDVVHGPYPSSQAAPIHERDIAEVGARALLTDTLLGRRVELTGPRSLTQEEMVAAISDAIGRPLRFQEVSPEAAKLGMSALGFSERFADAYLALLATTLDRPAVTTNEAETILGHPARDYTEWLSDHDTAFRAEYVTHPSEHNHSRPTEQS